MKVSGYLCAIFGAVIVPHTGRAEATGDVTHVYVQNHTSLRFSVCIQQRGDMPRNYKGWCSDAIVIEPAEGHTRKRMVLALDRYAPVGEYAVNVILRCGTEVCILKQKIVGNGMMTRSDFGISLEDCLTQDPWHMNAKAYDHHEHFVELQGRKCVVVYCAYPEGKNEDVKYILYEQSSPTTTDEEEEAPKRRPSMHKLAVRIPSLVCGQSTNTSLRILGVPFESLTRMAYVRSHGTNLREHAIAGSRHLVSDMSIDTDMPLYTKNVRTHAFHGPDRNVHTEAFI